MAMDLETERMYKKGHLTRAVAPVEGGSQLAETQQGKRHGDK
jgi:hypothetical protein